MKHYDISVEITNELAVWPTDRKPDIRDAMRIANGDEANTSDLSMGIHTATHIDAPYHFVSGGRAAGEIPLETLIGRARVIDIPGVSHINAEMLESLRLPPGSERLLFRTVNSPRWKSDRTVFHEEYVALTADAASWIVSKGIKLVGIDYLSVQPYEDKDQKTHRILLDAGVIILEGLDLSDVPAGEYSLFCLPLKMSSRDGAPARAILTSID